MAKVPLPTPDPEQEWEPAGVGTEELRNHGLFEMAGVLLEQAGGRIVVSDREVVTSSGKRICRYRNTENTATIFELIGVSDPR